jgi:ethanolamine kinase
VTSEAVEVLYKAVNKFALAVRLFWGTWALVQADVSTIDFDFLGYAILIFDEYKRRKREFLSL